MPPKFQSSFIPQGSLARPAAAPGMIPQADRPAARAHDLVGFVAKLIFGLSVVLAAGVLGYRWYLGYSIGKMSAELEAARQEVATGDTTELIRLNDRIVSTQALIDKHRVLTPIFAFLESSTPRDVRYTDFDFAIDKGGPRLVLKGEAKSYAALSLEASIIYKNKSLRDPVFSDIRLDDKGNVTFSLRVDVAQDITSYAKTVGRAASSTPAFATSTQSQIATSTLKASTTTAAGSGPTSSPQASSSQATSTKR